jgi:hypothetical protein
VLRVTASFRARDVRRGVVDDPRVVSCEDLGFYKDGVLTVKGKVSISQERGWATNGLRVEAGKTRAGWRQRTRELGHGVRDRGVLSGGG